MGLLKGLLTFQNFGNVRLLYRLPKRNRKHLNRGRLLDFNEKTFQLGTLLPGGHNANRAMTSNLSNQAKDR